MRKGMDFFLNFAAMTEKMKIRWGFIGCGEVTEKKSGPAFASIEGSEVVAVMSRNIARAEDYARRHNIARWYDDAQRLIDNPSVDAVYIATPPSASSAAGRPQGR